MRLLNAWTLRVEEFAEPNTPPYAILSHTWGSQEVLLHDIGTKKAETLKGYPKIIGCCEQAKQDGFAYVWIDTCCIDKTSSTELAEAINSMFTYYRKSVVCYAYLEDLNSAEVTKDTSLLRNSRWFTRGWTLQELIAPGTVVFFASGWEEIGSRHSLLSEISQVTGIDQDLFVNGKLSQYSIAQRMSWASKRETTRLEDEAYCLLGIFSVNMPLLYGEGKMAFIRLQEEIMRRSDDQSIFAWTMSGNSSTSGLLAPSPKCFEGSGEVLSAKYSTHQEPFSLTNKGIQISVPIFGRTRKAPLPPYAPMPGAKGGPKIVVTPPDMLIAVLNCRSQSGKRVALGIDRGGEDMPFRRTNADLGPLYLNAADCRRHAEVETIIVLAHQPLHDFTLWDKLKPTFFSIRGLPLPSIGWEVLAKFGAIAVDERGMLSASLSNGQRAGIVLVYTGNSKSSDLLSPSMTNTDHTFGIFLAETPGESCWELVPGPKAECANLVQSFRHKDQMLLTSKPVCRISLVPETKSSCNPLELVLETSRRPHGFSGILTMVDGDSGQSATRKAGLEERVGAQKQSQSHERIGSKDTKSFADTLSATSFSRGRRPTTTNGETEVISTTDSSPVEAKMPIDDVTRASRVTIRENVSNYSRSREGMNVVPKIIFTQDSDSNMS